MRYVIGIGLILMGTEAAMAQSLNLNLGEGSLSGRLVQLLGAISIISLAPSLLVMVTSFTRMIVVFSLLRSALGTQQTPPNPVIVSLALFLTAFVMGPVFDQAYKDGILPLMNETMAEEEAIKKAAQPFHGFMLSHVRDQDLKLFMDLGQEKEVAKPEDTPWRALVPGFMISELRRAFEIGFLLFVPFLIIDMVVASILMSMGMMMLPPVIISLPFKLIFFVLVDGWYLVAGSLIKSYGGG